MRSILYAFNSLPSQNNQSKKIIIIITKRGIVSENSKRVARIVEKGLVFFHYGWKIKRSPASLIMDPDTSKLPRISADFQLKLTEAPKKP